MDQSLMSVGASNIPVEILQHIFGLDAESYTRFELRPGAPRPALRLAHVSRAWRAAALGTSVLWSRLKVNISSDMTKSCANGHGASSWRWRSALDQFLALAQKFPLYISLTFSGTLQWSTDEEIQDIVAALFHTAPRWKSLGLVFDDYEPGDLSFLDPLHDKLDSLEKLHVMVFNGFGTPSRCTAFRDAPKLTKAFIVPDNGFLVELPWSRLFHADFLCNGGGDKAPIIHDLLVGLQKADQLKTLRCREYHGHKLGSITDQPVVVELPSLEEISLFVSSQLAHRLVLPSLSKLHVYESQPNSKDDSSPSVHLIQSLIVRSKCNIMSLTISDAFACRTVDGLRDISRYLPQLVSFRLKQDLTDKSIAAYFYGRAFRCDLSMGVFSLLTSPSISGSSPFPMLQDVTLSSRVESLNPDDLLGIFPSLSALLASRAQPDSSAATRVYAHARVYRPTQAEKKLRLNSRFQRPTIDIRRLRTTPDGRC